MDGFLEGPDGGKVPFWGAALGLLEGEVVTLANEAVGDAVVIFVEATGGFVTGDFVKLGVGFIVVAALSHCIDNETNMSISKKNNLPI